MKKKEGCILIILQSTDNPLVKETAKLHDSKWRKIYNRFIAEGTRTVSTIIQAGAQLHTLFAIESALDEARELATDDTIQIVSESVMKKLSPSTQPPGILGVFQIPSQPDIDYLAEGIVLAKINDPGNMGTLIRSCVAFGKKTVVIVGGCEPWNPKVIQACAGTIAQARIYQLTWDDLVHSKGNLDLCALVVTEGNKPEELSFENTLLVIGNEAHGIPSEWLKNCSKRLTLPMPGNTESLNAAVAGSIGMYLAWVKN